MDAYLPVWCRALLARIQGKYFRWAYLFGILVYTPYAVYKFFDENGVRLDHQTSC
jgi:hypothetical protein